MTDKNEKIPSAKTHIREKSRERCSWVKLNSQASIKYHDKEWGVPSHSDRRHFEFLLLEGAQAGLSWDTILNRRAHYKLAFANYDWKAVSRYNENKVEELMQNSGIIRNRRKIEAAINNAKCFEAIRKEFGTFDAYVWEFVKGKPIVGACRSLKEIPAESEESRALSKDLIRRGFKFVGPTIIYAYMQALGLVNDHLVCCFRYQEMQ